MSLGWAWRRRLWGISGAVLLAPVAVIAAIFALAPQTVGSTLNKVLAPKPAPAPRTIIGAVALS